MKFSADERIFKSNYFEISIKKGATYCPFSVITLMLFYLPSFTTIE